MDGTAILPEQVLGEPRRGLKLVFSGDTAACDALTDAAAGADLLIAEGTYAENAQAEMAAERGHMTFAQAAGIAARAGVRALWLAHYSQMIEDPAAYLPIAQAVFPGTVCGQDGMRTTLRFDSPCRQHGKRTGCAEEYGGGSCCERNHHHRRAGGAGGHGDAARGGPSRIRRGRLRARQPARKDAA